MRRVLIIATALLIAASSSAFAQRDCGGGFNLAIDCNGVGFGNSSRFNGLRFNWSDSDLDEINGLNFTLWRPRDWPRQDWMG